MNWIVTCYAGYANWETHRWLTSVHCFKEEPWTDEKKRADEIQMAQIEAFKELKLKEMELKAQSQASTSATVDPPPYNRDAKSPNLPAL